MNNGIVIVGFFVLMSVVFYGLIHIIYIFRRCRRSRTIVVNLREKEKRLAR